MGKHICLPAFLQDGGRDDLEAMAYIKHWAISCQSSSSVVSWLKDHGEERWRLSQAASHNRQLFKAILQTSSSGLGLTGCIGARLGINVRDLQGFRIAAPSVLLCWTSRGIMRFDTDPKESINFKRLLGEEWSKVPWIQYLCLHDIGALTRIHEQAVEEKVIGPRLPQMPQQQERAFQQLQPRIVPAAESPRSSSDVTIRGSDSESAPSSPPSLGPPPDHRPNAFSPSPSRVQNSPWSQRAFDTPTGTAPPMVTAAPLGKCGAHPPTLSPAAFPPPQLEAHDIAVGDSEDEEFVGISRTYDSEWWRHSTTTPMASPSSSTMLPAPFVLLDNDSGLTPRNVMDERYQSTHHEDAPESKVPRIGDQPPQWSPHVEWQEQEKRNQSSHNEEPGEQAKTRDPRIFQLPVRSDRDGVRADANDWRWHVSTEEQPPDYLLCHRQGDAQIHSMSYISELNGIHGTGKPEEIAKEYAAELSRSAMSNTVPPPVYSVEELKRAH